MANGRRIRVTGYIDMVAMDLDHDPIQDLDHEMGLSGEGYELVTVGPDAITLGDLEDLELELMPEGQ